MFEWLLLKSPIPPEQMLQEVRWSHLEPETIRAWFIEDRWEEKRAKLFVWVADTSSHRADIKLRTARVRSVEILVELLEGLQGRLGEAEVKSYEGTLRAAADIVRTLEGLRVQLAQEKEPLDALPDEGAKLLPLRGRMSPEMLEEMTAFVLGRKLTLVKK